MPVERNVRCVKHFQITERGSGRVMREFGKVSGGCLAAMPLRYGAKAAAVMQAPRRLKPDREYEINGLAEGSNYLGGAFKVTARRVWKVEDVAPAID